MRDDKQIPQRALLYNNKARLLNPHSSCLNRYCNASEMCSVLISEVSSKSAIVRATLRIFKHERGERNILRAAIRSNSSPSPGIAQNIFMCLLFISEFNEKRNFFNRSL